MARSEATVAGKVDSRWLIEQAAMPEKEKRMKGCVRYHTVVLSRWSQHEASPYPSHTTYRAQRKRQETSERAVSNQHRFRSLFILALAHWKHNQTPTWKQDERPARGQTRGEEKTTTEKNREEKKKGKGKPHLTQTPPA